MASSEKAELMLVSSGAKAKAEPALLADSTKPTQTAACSEAAFRRLYDEQVGFVWRSVRRLGVSDSAMDDVVQNVFVVAYLRLSQYRDTASLRGWLFGIARRVVSDHRRTVQRKEPHRRSDSQAPEPDRLAAPTQGNPERSVERREANRLLHRLLSQLDINKREVFILAELEGMSATEIAGALGVNANTVYSRLRAARRNMELAAQRELQRNCTRAS